MSSDANLVELRGDVEADVITVIDAVATANRSNRMAVVRGVLREWAIAKCHEASLIQRVTRGNGIAPESSGK